MSANKEIDPRIATLVRVDQSLRNANDPRTNFAMSPEMTEQAQDLRGRLSEELGLSARQIIGWKGFMVKGGTPYWRVGNGVCYENRTNGNGPDVSLKP